VGPGRGGAVRRIHVVAFLAVSAWGCVPGGEPSNPPVVQVAITPGHQQSYSAAPDRISISLIGHQEDVRPVLEVARSVEFLDLARSTLVALTPIETPRDVTYRGSEAQWFAFPPVGDGEYEIALTLTSWGLPLVAQSTELSDGDVWRSRFRLDANWFYVSGLSVCHGTDLTLTFSEPVGEMPVSEFATRIVVEMNQTVVSCSATSSSGTVGGSVLELRCASALQPPFTLTFAPALMSADGAKPLSARSPPHDRLSQLTISGAPQVQANDCAGWPTP